MIIRIPEVPFELQAEGPPGEWAYEDGVLSGRAGAGQDRFVPPGGDAVSCASDAPRLLGTPPAGDFQLVARVAVGFGADFDAGVLYVDGGSRDWAKLCYERSPALPTVCTVVTRDHSDDANAFVVPGGVVWLRVSRVGSAFAFHASASGDSWTFVRTFRLRTDPATARIGFLTQSPTGPGCTVSFSHIQLHPTAPTDLRDGS
ncbi:DUF1349 domain-containing protein [Streptomyces sp. NPDC060194]|uniref:DUF1349 domain-containing protein n=1 Tax=Streptomyces sp. NPDC060194 TaxID=3347069 RepID=UPI0036523F69